MNNLVLNFLQYYGIAISASIFFVTFIKISKSLGPDVSRYFTYCIIVNILLVLSDFGQAYYEALTYPTNLRMLFASSSYSLRVFILLCFIYLYYRNKPFKLKLILTIPGIINTLVSFSAFFTKYTFYYTEDNILVRGPLISFPFIASFFYFLVVVYESYKERNSKNNKSEPVLLLLVLIANTIATTLEAVFRLKGILTSTITISLAFYYFYFLNENYSYDQLTGACIRKKLYDDTLPLTTPYGIIAIDLDNLKILNDTSGHKAGDKALVVVSSAIKDCLKDDSRLYRIGGDEFIVIYKTNELFNVSKLVDKIKKAIDNTVYSATIGYSIREIDEEFQKALTRADDDLFRNKEKKKHPENENPVTI